MCACWDIGLILLFLLLLLLLLLLLTTTLINIETKSWTLYMFSRL